MNTVAVESAQTDSGFWVRDRHFYKQLLLLAVPVILQNQITFGVIFADNLMVGRLSEEAISGLYIGTLIQTLLQILLAGLESSILILSAQYWGRHDCERIKDVVSIGMRLGLIGTVFMFAASFLYPGEIMGLLTPDAGAAREGAAYLRAVSVSYLFFCVSQILITAMRSVEIVRIGLINSIVAFCVNVFLNYVLIFGHFGFPALGVRGAGYATCVSRAAELGVVLYFVLKTDRALCLKWRDFQRWDSFLFHDLVKYGTPLMLGQIVWAVNNFGQIYLIGQMKTAAMTAASVTGMLDRMLWMSTWGIASATGIIVGKAVGAGDYAKVKQYAKTMQVIFFGIGVFSSCFVLLVHRVFLNFYTLSPATYEIAVQFMLVLSVAMIGRCYQAPSLFGLVKSGGDTAFVCKNDAFWVLCWVLPASALALYVFHAPAWVVFALLLSDQFTKCFVAFVKINSFNWIHNLTRDRA